MNEQELLTHGYTRYGGGPAYKDCDFYMAKSYTDDIGKRYMIIFYAYDWTRWGNNRPVSYMPEIWIQLSEDKSTHTVLNGIFTLEETEKFAKELWEFSGKPYLEKWDED